jgi:NarL family two-component system response regulator YdfI
MRRSMEYIRTTVIGGSPLLQAGMIAALEQDARIKLIDRLQDAQDAITHARQQACDVLVLNADIPHLEAGPIIKGLADAMAMTKVLIFTANESYAEIVETFRLGVHGYGIHTALWPEDVCSAIVAVADRGMWLCPQTARRLLDAAFRWASVGPPRWGTDVPLSQRESEVLSLAAAGAKEDDIADTLCLSRNTVKTYLRRIREKLQTDTRAAAVSLALERGLLPARWPDEPPNAVLASNCS